MASNLKNLPLYNILVAKLNERINSGNFSITPEYKERLSNVLSTLDPSRATEISVLLTHHCFLTHPNSNPFNSANYNPKSYSRSKENSLPFDIRISSTGKGFSFDLEKMPLELQALLGIYCCL